MTRLSSIPFFQLFLLLAIGLAALSVLSLLFSQRLRRQTGLPEGDVVYEDADGESEETLISEEYALSGKPDYLLEGENDELIPVEVKSSNAPTDGRPYRSHRMQLAAYLLLVEEVLDCPAPYGLIRYRDRTLRVEHTDELIDELLSIVDEMKVIAAEGKAHRNHKQPRRCAGCSVAHACDERLE